MRVDLPILRLKESFVTELKWLAQDPHNPVRWIDFLKLERELKMALSENIVSKQLGVSARLLWDSHIANDDEIRSILSWVSDQAAMTASGTFLENEPFILISMVGQEEVKMLCVQDLEAAIYAHFKKLTIEELAAEGSLYSMKRQDRFQPDQGIYVESDENDVDGIDVESADSVSQADDGVYLGYQDYVAGVVDQRPEESEEEFRIREQAAVGRLFGFFTYSRNCKNRFFPVDEDLVSFFHP